MPLISGFSFEAFQSTPPVRGATKAVYLFKVCHNISIHAPRAGGDKRISAFP